MPDLDAVIPVKALEVTVDFGGPDATVVLSFDANKVTPRWYSELRNRILAEDDIESVAKALAEVIIGWNLTAAGAPIEPSAETLARFPIGHLDKLMEAISEVPTSEEGKASSELSSDSPPAPLTDSTPQPLEKQPTPQNGELTSPSPALSASQFPT